MRSIKYVVSTALDSLALFDENNAGCYKSGFVATGYEARCDISAARGPTCESTSDSGRSQELQGR